MMWPNQPNYNIRSWNNFPRRGALRILCELKICPKAGLCLKVFLGLDITWLLVRYLLRPRQPLTQGIRPCLALLRSISSLAWLLLVSRGVTASAQSLGACGGDSVDTPGMDSECWGAIGEPVSPSFVFWLSRMRNFCYIPVGSRIIMSVSIIF